MPFKTILKPVCECCGTSDPEIMRKMPKVMTSENEGRFICKDCVIEWYDGGGSTDPRVIGRAVIQKRMKDAQTQ